MAKVHSPLACTTCMRSQAPPAEQSWRGSKILSPDSHTWPIVSLIGVSETQVDEVCCLCSFYSQIFYTLFSFRGRYLRFRGDVAQCGRPKCSLHTPGASGARSHRIHLLLLDVLERYLVQHLWQKPMYPMMENIDHQRHGLIPWPQTHRLHSLHSISSCSGAADVRTSCKLAFRLTAVPN